MEKASVLILEPKKIKSVIVSIFSPSICHEVMGPDGMIVFWMLSFKLSFSLSSFTFIKRDQIQAHQGIPQTSNSFFLQLYDKFKYS